MRRQEFFQESEAPHFSPVLRTQSRFPPHRSCRHISRSSLCQAGYIVGQTVVIEYGWATNHLEKMPANYGVRNRPVRLIAAICFALGALIVGAAGSAAQPLPRSVLILNQSTSFGPWQNTIIAAIRSTMNEGAAEPVTFYMEHLDFSRFKGQQYLSSLENHFREKYRDKPIGVMVTIGPVAVDYALKMRAALWPSVPIVFTAVEDTYVNSRQHSIKCDRRHDGSVARQDDRSGTYRSPKSQGICDCGYAAGRPNLLPEFCQRSAWFFPRPSIH